MTMRRGARGPRRQTLWTAHTISIGIAAASSGVTGQGLNDIKAIVEAKLGRSMQGLTLTRTYLQGWWQQVLAATSPVWGRYTVAVVRAPEGMDAADFGDLAVHTGDIELFDQRALLETVVADDVLFPRTDLAGSGMKIESRGQRKIERENDTIFVVVQKSIVTEQTVRFDGSLTCTWLLP